MAVPANLFVEAPEVQDRSLTRLNSDPNVWPEEIITKLKERVPSVEGTNIMVKFMKKDLENGSATGSVVINTPENVVIVPVIIKDFTMFPLDVMIAKKKILPFNTDYFNSAIASNQVFDKIQEYPTYQGLGRFEDANMWNAMYPPSLGRYAYASAGYPMLDFISDNLDGSSLKEWIKSNPEYAVGFYKHGHAEVLKKLANLKPVNMNEFTVSAEKLIPKNIRMLKYDGPDKYSLLSSNDKVFSPALDYLTRDGALKLMSRISDHADDDINEVDQNGEKMLMLPEAGEGVFLARTDKEIPEQAKEFDHYFVKDKNGMGIEGVVVPKVIDFNQKPVDLKIFLGKTMSTIQPEIWGVRIKNSRFKPEFTIPRVGQTGTFVFMPDKSHALCTIPVTIRSVTNDCGQVKIKASDLMGRPYHMSLSTFHGLQRIATGMQGEYILPKEMKWTVMEGFGDVTNSAESYAVKTAGDKLTATPVKLASTGYGFYSIRGVNKYAAAAGWDHTNVKEYQAKFLLSCLGCSQEKIASAMTQARLKGVAEIHGLNFIPLKSEKIAEFRPKANAAVKIASKLKRNLIKEASYIDDSQTVDALLSLNFITPDNIAKFVGKIPHYKATISNLASALLASRLGIGEIPEEACVVAIENLVQVVDGLDKLRSTQDAKAV